MLIWLVNCPTTTFSSVIISLLPNANETLGDAFVASYIKFTARRYTLN